MAECYPKQSTAQPSSNVYPLDLDPISSLDRENQVTDMSHQRLEQSQSQSSPQPCSASARIEHNRLLRSDPSSRVIEENDDIISNEFEVDFWSGLGLLLQNSDNPNCDDDDANSGFMVADSVDDLNLHGSRFESDDSSQGSDSDEAGENEIISVEDADCDDDDGDASFHFCWDAFHLEDEITPANPNPNPNSNANEDFEWEEVSDQINERETLSMFFGAEPDDDASVSPVLLTTFAEPSEERDPLEWQVLSNVNFEQNPDSEQQQYDEYSYTEHEMFFGQFADSDVVPSSGRPPASKTAVINLTTVVMTREDAVDNNALCAVCKDEVAVGEVATQLPCSHRYHGDCIVPWLAVRNTCPVCRHELPTDDPGYERRKAERGGQA